MEKVLKQIQAMKQLLDLIKELNGQLVMLEVNLKRVSGKVVEAVEDLGGGQ